MKYFKHLLIAGLVALSVPVAAWAISKPLAKDVVVTSNTLGTDVQSALDTVEGDLPSQGAAPVDAKYIVQQANSTLTNEQALGALSTGLVKNTTTSGILSIATAGTDYVVPGSVLTSGLTQSTNRLLGRTTGATGAIEEITVSSPLTFTGGVLTIQNAAADASTKGAATFNASDFDSSSGLISIDYTNGQSATTSLKGFLTAANWNTFNNSASTTTTLNGTTGVLVGNGASGYFGRTIVGTNPIVITNGTGVAGNPTVALTPSPTISGTVTGDQYIDNGLTVNTVVYANGTKQLTSSATTPTELGYLSGVTSALQTQIDGKVPTTRTVNSHALSSNVTVTASDVGLGNVTNNAQVNKATSSTIGTIPKWSVTTGDAIVDGYAVVTTVANPGLDTNFATEKAIRTAITGSSGNVNGPGSSTTDNFPSFADTTGKLLKDSGKSAASFEVPLTFSTGLTRTTNTVTVNTSQNIATLSNLTSNGFVTTSGGVGTLGVGSITLSGDVSGSGTTAITTTIGAGAVSLAKMANLAANSIIGNNTGSGATPLALSISQVRSLLSLNNVENTALSTWPGTSNITTLGAITTGTWNATPVTELYGGTNQSSYALGDTLYASAANTLLKLAGNTTSTKEFLRQTGTGTVSAAPAWDTVTKTDVGLANVENTALSTWPGSTVINTVGTLTAGTWNATQVDVPYGGTNLTSLSQGDLIYGSAANTFSKLAKSASSTRYLSNTGTSNNPAWAQVDMTTGVTGALPVANGGSGDTTHTAYAVLCGGTTTTAAVQSVASVGTSGQVLTSNGASALPTFQSPASTGRLLGIQYFTSGGTWTKPAGCTQAFIRVQAGGGGSGNAGATGGGGGYSERFVTGSLGSTETVTVGAAGTGGDTGQAGTAGGTSSFGSWASATGGSGGAASGLTGAAGGTGSSGDMNVSGGYGMEIVAGGAFTRGGDSAMGTGAVTNASGTYQNAAGYGGGGIGGHVNNAGAGIVIVYAYS